MSKKRVKYELNIKRVPSERNRFPLTFEILSYFFFMFFMSSLHRMTYR